MYRIFSPAYCILEVSVVGATLRNGCTYKTDFVKQKRVKNGDYHFFCMCLWDKVCIEYFSGKSMKSIILARCGWNLPLVKYKFFAMNFYNGVTLYVEWSKMICFNFTSSAKTVNCGDYHNIGKQATKVTNCPIFPEIGNPPPLTIKSPNCLFYLRHLICSCYSQLLFLSHV